MKARHAINFALAAQFLTVACDQNPAEAQTVAAGDAPAAAEADPASTKSAHFDTVASRLDVGGTFLGYVDVAGDLDNLIERGQKMYEMAREEGAPFPEVEIKDVVAELGLQSVTALGASSMPIEDERFRNQGFIHTPDGAKGLLTLFGKEAKPLASPTMAPADTDIIVEQEFRLSALKDIALGVYAKLPKEDLDMPPLDELMQQPIPSIDMTVEEVLDKANGKAIFLAKFHQDEQVMIPAGPNPITIPAIDFLLELQDMGWVFEKLQGFLPAQGPFQIENGEGYTKLSVPIPPEVPFAFYQPVLYHDHAANKLTLASRDAYRVACMEGAGEKISSDATYQALTKGFPTEGNAFSFLSARVKDTVVKTLDGIMEQQEQNMGAAEKTIVMQMLELLLASIDAGASITTHQTDGIHMIANTKQSFKSSLLSGSVAPLFMAIAGQRAAVAQARQAVEVRELAVAAEAAAVAEPALGGDNMAGLEQTIAALRMYAVKNNGQFPDALADLSPDYLSDDELTDATSWPTPTGVKPLIYFAGLSVDTEGNPIVLASPANDDDGNRAVAHVGGDSKKVSAADFAKLARAAIERAAP